MSIEDYDVILTEFNGETLEFWFPKTEEELETALNNAEINQENIEADIERFENPFAVPEEDEAAVLLKEKDMADLRVQLIKDRLKALKEGK